MIKILKKGNLITISGHADYATSGKDIVCASVSSIMYTTVNAIMRFNAKAIRYHDDGTIVTIEELVHDPITSGLIANMLELFHDLVIKYPKNIMIESEE